MLNAYFILQTSTNALMVLLSVTQKPLTVTTLFRATNASAKKDISQYLVTFTGVKVSKVLTNFYS